MSWLNCLRYDQCDILCLFFNSDVLNGFNGFPLSINILKIYIVTDIKEYR